jgi:RNA recognition motif-containing protein
LGPFGKASPASSRFAGCSVADTRFFPGDRQIRQGIANNSKGTAFVVYEDVHDAKQACDKLNGFNFQNRYLVGTYDEEFKPLMDLEADGICAQSCITSRKKCSVRKKISRRDKKISNDLNSSMG